MPSLRTPCRSATRGSSTYLVEAPVACYRLSGRPAYRVHALIRLTTTASRTQWGTSQAPEPFSHQPKGCVMSGGPRESEPNPSETCSQARKMGRRIVESCDEGTRHLNPIRRENPISQCADQSAGPLVVHQPAVCRLFRCDRYAT